MSKRLKKKIFSGFIIIVFLLIFSFILIRNIFYEVPILTYHFIDVICPQAKSLCVSPQSFQRQMDFISRNHYKVISLEELVVYLAKGKRLSYKTVVITFDDGGEDLYRNALPVLKKYGFKALIFIIADRIGQTDYLSWQQIRKMLKVGIDIGSHSYSHPYLPQIYDEKKLRKEIFDSKKEIELAIARPVKIFSYPVGGYTPKIKDLVKEAGYIGACTTDRGRYQRKPDIFALRRIKMTEDSAKSLKMWIKLSGIYNLLRKK
jgi:peptidoglycan/xylan/chitin deacetylase (PgdA/CDA1 family)